MLSALAVFLCDNYLVIFRLALLFLITKLLRIFEVAIIYVGNHSDIHSPLMGLDKKRRRGKQTLGGVELSEFGPLSAAFGFLFFTIAMKGLFYGKSGMTA